MINIPKKEPTFALENSSIFVPFPPPFLTSIRHATTSRILPRVQSRQRRFLGKANAKKVCLCPKPSKSITTLKILLPLFQMIPSNPSPKKRSPSHLGWITKTQKTPTVQALGSPKNHFSPLRRESVAETSKGGHSVSFDFISTSFRIGGRRKFRFLIRSRPFF